MNAVHVDGHADGRARRRYTRRLSAGRWGRDAGRAGTYQARTKAIESPSAAMTAMRGWYLSGAGSPSGRMAWP